MHQPQQLLSSGLREGWAESPRRRLALPGRSSNQNILNPAPQRASIIPVFHGPDASSGTLSIAAGYLM